MGLGKTVTTLALVAAHASTQVRIRFDPDQRMGCICGCHACGDATGNYASPTLLHVIGSQAWLSGYSRLVRCKTTLIVCPPTLLGQWEQEIKTRSNAGLRYFVHHSSKKKLSSYQDLQSYDIVLTTYVARVCVCIKSLSFHLSLTL
jgi:SNF2 family DNA or RNA helicase